MEWLHTLAAILLFVIIAILAIREERRPKTLIQKKSKTNKD